MEDLQPQLVVIRFSQKYLQSARNSLVKNSSILRQYHGKVLGIAEELDIVQGNGALTKKDCLAILYFNSLRDAKMWYDGCPEIKQHDWLGGVDLVRFPLTGSPPSPYHYIQLIQVRIKDNPLFDQLMSESGDKKKWGATECVNTPSSCVRNLRGNWPCDTHFVINEWASGENFDAWKSSDEQRAMRDKAKKAGDSFVVLFYLYPLKTDHETYCMGRHSPRK